MGVRRFISPLLALAVGTASPLLPAYAAVIAQHQGSTSPAAEGFTNNVGGAVYGSPVSNDLGLGIAAWHIDGGWSSAYDQTLLSAADVTTLQTQSWTLTARMRDITSGIGDRTGIYADVIFGGRRFDIDLQRDASGNLVLSSDSFTGGGSRVVIGGTGSSYDLFRLIYDPMSGTANYYVNGILRIANDPGTTDAYPSVLLFGGVNGNFNLVQLQSGVPEPSTWALLLAGFGGLGLLRLAGKRKRRTA